MSCYCAPSCAIPSCPQPCCPQPSCPQPCCPQPSCPQPSCSQPSCPQSSCSQPCCSPYSYPVGGLGSLSCCPTSSCSSSCCGTSTSARALGITSGASVGCVNQVPPSEVWIQPPACTVTIPGSIMAAACEPLKMGGYTACGGSGSSSSCGLPSCGYLGISSSCKPSDCHRGSVSKMCS